MSFDTGYYLLDHDKHPNVTKFHTSRRKDIQVAVVHTAENLPDLEGGDSGAENVSAYGANTDRQVSWHWTVDSDSRIQNLPDHHTAFHVKGYNSLSLGLEIATQAHRWKSAKDRTDWERAVLKNTALVLAHWCRKHDIPPVRLSKADVDAGKKGIVSHSALDPKRRSDPGIGFPWDELFDLLEAELETSEKTPEKPKPEPKPEKTPTPSKPAPAPSSSSQSWEEKLLVKLGVLKKGSRGNDVKRLQHNLALFRIYPKVDGIFGPKTERAVTEFQEGQRIGIDGVVGPQTWTQLLDKGKF